jgi:hypothetical protein
MAVLQEMPGPSELVPRSHHPGIGRPQVARTVAVPLRFMTPMDKSPDFAGLEADVPVHSRTGCLAPARSCSLFV